MISQAVQRATRVPIICFATSSTTTRHASCAATSAIAPLSVRICLFVISKDMLFEARRSADGPIATRMLMTKMQTTLQAHPLRPANPLRHPTSGEDPPPVPSLAANRKHTKRKTRIKTTTNTTLTTTMLIVSTIRAISQPSPPTSIKHSTARPRRGPILPQRQHTPHRNHP